MPVSRTPKREDAKVKHLGKLVPLEIYLAADVVDGAGEKGHHIVFRPTGTKQFYRLLPAGAEAAMRPVAEWLNVQIEAAIAAQNPPKEVSPTEAMPPDMGLSFASEEK